MPKTYDQADDVINYFLRNTAAPQSATVYLGLFLTTPTGPGDAGTEVTIGSNAYARVAVTFVDPTGTGVTSNSAILTFPTATPAQWGTINGVGIFGSAAGADLLYYADVTTPKLIDAMDTAKFAAGALQLTEQ
jgi:hypothetical protein